MGQQGKLVDHIYSTTSTGSRTSRHLFTVCIGDNYPVFLIAARVIMRLLLDEIYPSLKIIT